MNSRGRKHPSDEQRFGLCLRPSRTVGPQLGGRHGPASERSGPKRAGAGLRPRAGGHLAPRGHGFPPGPGLAKDPAGATGAVAEQPAEWPAAFTQPTAPFRSRRSVLPRAACGPAKFGPTGSREAQARCRPTAPGRSLGTKAVPGGPALERGGAGRWQAAGPACPASARQAYGPARPPRITW